MAGPPPAIRMLPLDVDEVRRLGLEENRVRDVGHRLPGMPFGHIIAVMANQKPANMTPNEWANIVDRVVPVINNMGGRRRKQKRTRRRRGSTRRRRV